MKKSNFFKSAMIVTSLGLSLNVSAEKYPDYCTKALYEEGVERFIKVNIFDDNDRKVREEEYREGQLNSHTLFTFNEEGKIESRTYYYKGKLAGLTEFEYNDKGLKTFEEFKYYDTETGNLKSTTEEVISYDNQGRLKTSHVVRKYSNNPTPQEINYREDEWIDNNTHISTFFKSKDKKEVFSIRKKVYEDGIVIKEFDSNHFKKPETGETRVRNSITMHEFDDHHQLIKTSTVSTRQEMGSTRTYDKFGNLIEVESFNISRETNQEVQPSATFVYDYSCWK